MLFQVALVQPKISIAPLCMNELLNPDWVRDNLSTPSNIFKNLTKIFHFKFLPKAYGIFDTMIIFEFSLIDF
jgi:hypothetical protein